MMTVCPKHQRWTVITRADGTTARRACPECPRQVRRFLHMPTGRVMVPAVVVEQDGRLTINGGGS